MGLEYQFVGIVAQLLTDRTMYFCLWFAVPNSKTATGNQRASECGVLLCRYWHGPVSRCKSFNSEVSVLYAHVLSSAVGVRFVALL